MHPSNPIERPAPLRVRSRGFATTSQAADFMGLTRHGLAKLIRENKIPARKFGRVYRISWQWLCEQERTSAA
jgi:excisionase family DNA binding protein